MSIEIDKLLMFYMDLYFGAKKNAGKRALLK